jgi:cytochrome P450
LHAIISIAEAFLLVLISWPLIRLLKGRELQPFFGSQEFTLAGLLLGWFCIIVILASWYPVALHVVSAAFLLAFAVFAWRGRVAFGKARGLPPGSLALGASISAIANRNFYLQQARQHGPVFKMAQFNQPVVCVVGLDRGFRLFREHRDALGPSELPFNKAVTGGFLRYMDDKTHARYAPLFMKALSAKNLAPLMPAVAVTCKEVLEQMSRDCRDSADNEVAPGAYCKQLAFFTLLRVLFGLSKDMPQFREMMLVYSALEQYSLSRPVTKSVHQSIAQLRQYLLAYCADTQKTSSSELDSSTLVVLKRINPEMPDEVCIDNLLFILKIATDNLAGLLQWIFKMLGEHPEILERIHREDNQPSATDAKTLADCVVRETLRLSQSEYLYRKLKKDVSFEGYTLPGGWLLRLCIWEGHRTCRSVEDPERFNPDRFRERELGINEYSPFGYGKHACNGAHLAQMIAGEFIRALAKGFTLKVGADGPVERDFRHWRHWRPSSQFRVEICPKAATTV